VIPNLQDIKQHLRLKGGSQSKLQANTKTRSSEKVGPTINPKSKTCILTHVNEYYIIIDELCERSRDRSLLQRNTRIAIELTAPNFGSLLFWRRFMARIEEIQEIENNTYTKILVD